MCNFDLVYYYVIPIVSLLYSFPGKAVGVRVSNQAAPAGAATTAQPPKVCTFISNFDFLYMILFHKSKWGIKHKWKKDITIG